MWSTRRCGELNRDVRFRRALSLGINRDQINQVIYFGLGLPVGNTVAARKPALSRFLCDRLGELRPGQGERAARRDRPDRAQFCRHPIAAERQAARNHRRDRGREQRRGRRARVDSQRLRPNRHQDVHAALAARSVPQPHLCRRDRNVGLAGARERHCRRPA